MDYKAKLGEQSRTAVLWLKYLDYVQIPKDFIRADRTSDWFLHLSTVKKMLYIFAAAGHRSYAKAARIYLQLMHELPETHSSLYKRLAHGFHAIHRTDRCWAGLPMDLIIEQTMMRTAKSRGGLTHGRGMTESVCVIWVRSLHRCATIYAALSTLTNVESGTPCMRHVELGQTRSKCDFSDLQKMIVWFQVHSPFDINDGMLFSLSSGITAAKHEVNCDQEKYVRQQIMEKVDNITFSDVVVKKSDQVTTLSGLCYKMVGTGSKLPLDSTLLFSRLLVVAQRSSDMAAYFAYELIAVP